MPRVHSEQQHKCFTGFSLFWDGLHHFALTGEPGFKKIFKQPVFEYIGTHPEIAPILDAAMTDRRHVFS
jgi:hypothetical protein